MNSHDSRCRCENCQVRSLIKILENTQERLLYRVAELEKRVERLTTKSVSDPEFDWTKVEEKLEVHVGVNPTKLVPPMLPEGCYVATDEDLRNVLQQIESDRAREEAYFEDRATGSRTVEIASDESAQPFVMGGEG